MVEKEKCEVCQVDPVSSEVLVLREHVPTSIPKAFPELNVGDPDPWIDLKICSVCGLFFFSELPKRVKFVRSVSPKRVLRVSREVGDLGVCSALFAEKERILHGVSWLEANGLEQWLFPEVIRRTRDIVLWRRWFRYSLFDYLIVDLSDVEEAYRSLISYLKRSVFRSRDERLRPLFKKLRYIFQKYSDAYTFGNPPSISEEDWERLVSQIRKMFESDPFDPEWRPVLDWFCDHLSAFWW